ncbi:hypothetical protein HYALB_00010890 [Hymenoscyphus albidus]|uniref:Berberine/berberine-like domain-containing protein n=1 Tax=Hymenoscyphus albidus TaxID=595503 RepID=A0A9N9Q314_9HELO|nr:hypothetical protein HYALB_00010890 [Hymenoscyphus albidus]
MKSYPVTTGDNGAWTGTLIFTEDKIEALVATIKKLQIPPELAVYLYYVSSGPSDKTPTVIISPYYTGTEEAGKKIFAPFYAIGPITDTTAWLPYHNSNDGSNSFCIKGGRKPAFGVGLGQTDPATGRSVWNSHKKFLQNPEAANSVVLVEAYSMGAARSFSLSSSAYAHRDTINFHVAVLPWYNNSSFDKQALAWGSQNRDLLRSTDMLDKNSTYINFAFADPLETIYGTSLGRLKILKKRYDPFNRFGQYFSLGK